MPDKYFCRKCGATFGNDREWYEAHKGTHVDWKGEPDHYVNARRTNRRNYAKEQLAKGLREPYHYGGIF